MADEKEKSITPAEPSNGELHVLTDATDDLNKFVGDMPEVVPDAIAASENKEREIQAENKTFLDNKGRAFDSTLHATDGTGNPITTPTGRFKRKINAPQDKARLNLPEKDTVNPISAQIRAQATMWADAFIHLGISLCGDEWKPEKTEGYDERGALIAANERFMIAHGIVQLPPWAELALAHVMYAAKRLGQPKTQSFFKRAFTSIKTGLTNLWLKVTGQDIRVKKVEPKDK